METARHTQTNPHHRVCLIMCVIPVGTSHQRTNALNYNYNTSHLIYLTASQIHLWNGFTPSRYICLIQSLVFCPMSVCLLTCLHFEISSVLLLRMLFPLNDQVNKVQKNKKSFPKEIERQHKHYSQHRYSINICR